MVLQDDELLEINPIMEENIKSGSQYWTISRKNAAFDLIQGYVTPISVKVGDRLNFHVATKSKGQKYKIHVYRLGWYEAAGGRRLYQSPELLSSTQGTWSAHKFTSGSRSRSRSSKGSVSDAQWPISHELTVPEDWPSGQYIARFSLGNGKASFHPFWVKQPPRRAQVLMVASTISHQVTNWWGISKSSLLFSLFHQEARVQTFSFARPFYNNHGGDFLRWENPLVRWLERNSVDVTYITDVDLHQDPDLVWNYPVILLAGNCRYWTRIIQETLKQAVAKGQNLVILGSHAGIQPVTLQRGLDGLSQLRVIVDYGTVRKFNPLTWSQPAGSLRQGSLANLRFLFHRGDWPDLVFSRSDHPLFQNTGIDDGSRVTGLLGHDWDSIFEGEVEPEVIMQIVASSLGRSNRGKKVEGHAVVLQYPEGGYVFNAGTTHWSWGLHDWGPHANVVVDPRLERLTLNLLGIPHDRPDLKHIKEVLRERIRRELVSEIWGEIVKKPTAPKALPLKMENVKTASRPTFVILTCVWGRPNLTRIILSYYQQLKLKVRDRYNLELLAVGSEGPPSRQICEEHGFHYFEYENQPMSRKWNHAVKMARKLDPTALIIVGSDDILSEKLLDFYYERLRERYLMVGVKDFYIYDSNSRKLVYWRGYGQRFDAHRMDETIGLGRCLSRPLLDKLDFDIWGGMDLERGLDGAMTERLREVGLFPCPPDKAYRVRTPQGVYRVGHVAYTMEQTGAALVDVKTRTNVTTFQRYLDRDPESIIYLEPNLLENYFDPALLKQITDLKKE